MFLESIVIAIIFGKITGGKFTRLAYLDFKRIWIFILAIAIQTGIVLFGISGNELVLQYINELNILSYILLAIGFVINYKHRMFLILLLGMLTNVFVMFFNNWKMPISIDGLNLTGYTELAEIIQSGNLAFYTVLDSTTKFGYLGKIITVPPPYFFPTILSIGDIFISLGLFLFILDTMKNDDLGGSNMLSFKYKSRI